MTAPCLPKLELIGVMGYEVRGTCGAEPGRRVSRGEECVDLPPVPSTCWARFGASEVVSDRHFSPLACVDFRHRVLKLFGPGGPRMISGPRSPATEGERATDLADFGAVPDTLQEQVSGRPAPTMASRLAEGLRAMFSWRPSDAFRKNAKAIEDERAEHAARQASGEGPKT